LRAIIKELSGLAVAFQLSHISDIVERECVVRVERIRLAEILVRGAKIIAVRRCNAAHIEISYLFFDIVSVRHTAAQCAGAIACNLAHRAALQAAIKRDGSARGGMQRGGFVVILERILRLAFHFFCHAHVVQRENIVRVRLQRTLQQRIGLEGAPLRKQPRGFDIVVVDLERLIGRESLAQRLTFHPPRAGLINDCIGHLRLRQSVVPLRSIDLPLQL
jgi:hypothetical protein